MVELKDFITTMQTNMDNYILNEASKGILKYSIKIAVDVNEERCKEWIKQAMEIETFTKEQIEDLKVRNLFDKLEKENEKLKEQVVEQADYKDEYYHYWQKTKEENKRLKQTRKKLRKKLEQEEKSNTGNISDAEEIIDQQKERIATLEEALKIASKKICKDSDYALLQCALLEEQAKERIEKAKENKS